MLSILGAVAFGLARNDVVLSSHAGARRGRGRRSCVARCRLPLQQGLIPVEGLGGRDVPERQVDAVRLEAARALEREIPTQLPRSLYAVEGDPTVRSADEALHGRRIGAKGSRVPPLPPAEDGTRAHVIFGLASATIPPRRPRYLSASLSPCGAPKPSAWLDSRLC